MVSATEQRARITATSLLRQLEQPTASTADEHLSTLKRQATAKHVRQLLATLEDSDAPSSSSTIVPRGSIADLKQRLARAEASLSLSASTSSAKVRSKTSTTNFLHPQSFRKPLRSTRPMPSPLDFLLPTAPSLPASLSRPGSRAGSPAPSHHSHANLLRGAGAGDYTPSNYAPSDYTPSSYTPTSLRTHDLDREPSFGSAGRQGSEASLSPSRARPSGSERRQRSRSTAGGPDDDYTPDAYSPVKSLKESSAPSFDFNTSGGGSGVDLRAEEEDEEGGLGLGNGSGRSRRKSNAVEDEDGVDEEAFFGGGAKPPFPPPSGADDEADIDPESGIGFAVEDADGEDVDPEAGGMSFVSSRSHSGSVSSAGGRSARTFSPPPSSTLAPPPKSTSGGLNRRTSVSSNSSANGSRTSPSPSSMRNRRPSAPPQRVASPLSRSSRTPEHDRNELLSGVPTATPSDLLSHHHSLQSSLMDNLTSLSTQLKTNSQTFASNLEKDKAVMADAKDKLEGNYEKMKQQQVRLKEQKGRSRGTLCWTIVVVSGVAIAWVVMFFLIKVT
ncbi:hypothetical protein BCR35DRAFT_300000 [Leucosporidium creatinivorum]|uniref:Uncharacterized protein n=1 Tax=Leucosporidium creatinivorum TaxID=106004 RepID=A0A1Y2FZL7_9BASI|nr:hypothetical protein BCR35DRAFT_300000 [Leucosporidium creatinivorum]